MADKRYYVYYLLDPESNRVRYVGCSCRPSGRFYDHIEAKDDSHRARWIRQLLAKELRPLLSIRCIVETEEEMFRIEMALIARLRELGEQLTNMTVGGEGLMNPSLETRAKKSASMKGKQNSLGHVCSDETKQKIRESRLRFNAEHPEVVARVAAASLGNKHSLGYRHTNEAKQAMANAKLGNTNGSQITDAGREAKRIAMTGNPSRAGMTNSLESNARRSENGRKAWALKMSDPAAAAAFRAEKKAIWARRKLAEHTARIMSERDSAFDEKPESHEEMFTA